MQIQPRFLKLWCFLYFMNEKFNKNAKVEKLTKKVGRGVRLIVIGPFDSNVLVEQMIKLLGKDARLIFKCPLWVEWTKAWSNTSMNSQWIYVYMDFCAPWGEDQFVVVQHFRCRKICQIVCGIPMEWIKSKYLDQDVDVVFLANKGIVIGSFVGGNYNEILTETGKLMDNIRVTQDVLLVNLWMSLYIVLYTMHLY